MLGAAETLVGVFARDAESKRKAYEVIAHA